MYCKIAKNEIYDVSKNGKHWQELEKDDFICPGVDENGHCTVFTDEGVAAKERYGYCNYKEIRRPVTETEIKRIRVGQQKQAKRKVKPGNVE